MHRVIGMQRLFIGDGLSGQMLNRILRFLTIGELSFDRRLTASQQVFHSPLGLQSSRMMKLLTLLHGRRFPASHGCFAGVAFIERFGFGLFGPEKQATWKSC